MLLEDCGVGEDSARSSNQSILKEINPEYSLEWLMLKLKLQYFSHPMQSLLFGKKFWCWERLKGGEGDDRGWDGWMASPTQWTWVWASSRRREGWGSLACYSPWAHKESDMTKWLKDNSSYSCLDFKWKRASELAIQLTTGNWRCVVIHHPVSHSCTASFGEAMPPIKGFPSLASLQSGKTTLLRYSCAMWGPGKDA